MKRAVFVSALVGFFLGLACATGPTLPPLPPVPGPELWNAAAPDGGGADAP